MKRLVPLVCLSMLTAVSTLSHAEDSVSDARVRAALSEPLIAGHAHAASTRRAVFAATGMSTSAGRVQQALEQPLQGVRGAAGGMMKARYQANDAGKSVSATRVEHALNDSV
ncbi:MULTISPECIES: hypothetical protein [Cobetia]|uniref:hypothetical protein n=1 Tax=Cobetia TaxID=204286 RepID=UPI0009849CCE|nr:MULTISPECIES: hypothetical protein [Cobetia]POR06110.1 hypothetical protein BOH68_11995 [Cobetia sp. MM1IDA2H-1]